MFQMQTQEALEWGFFFSFLTPEEQMTVDIA